MSLVQILYCAARACGPLVPGYTDYWQRGAYRTPVYESVPVLRPSILQVQRQASARLREHFSTPALTEPIRVRDIKEEEDDTLERRRPQPM
jgi:hypothetical protein